MKRRTGYLTLRNKTWYANWSVNGKHFAKTTGKRNRREAEKEMRRIMEPFTARDEVAILENLAGRLSGQKAKAAKLHDEQTPPLEIQNAWEAYRSSNRRPF